MIKVFLGFVHSKLKSLLHAIHCVQCNRESFNAPKFASIGVQVAPGVGVHRSHRVKWKQEPARPGKIFGTWLERRNQRRQRPKTSTVQVSLLNHDHGFHRALTWLRQWRVYLQFLEWIYSLVQVYEESRIALSRCESINCVDVRCTLKHGFWHVEKA